MLVILCSTVFLLVGYFLGGGRASVICLKCLSACVRRQRLETDEMTNGHFFMTRFMQILKEDFPELFEVIEHEV